MSSGGSIAYVNKKMAHAYRGVCANCGHGILIVHEHRRGGECTAHTRQHGKGYLCGCTFPVEAEKQKA